MSRKPAATYTYATGALDESSDKDNLNAGTLGVNSSFESNGMVKVDYTLNNLDGFCAFNAYAWCNISNQGQDISWTNAVTSSGYTVSL